MATENLDRAVAWWEKMFDATVLSRGTFELPKRATAEHVDARVAVVAGPGFTLELVEVPGRFKIPEMFAEPPDHTLPIGSKGIILKTPDLAKLTEELEAKGVVFLWKAQQFGDQGSVSAIRDSEGNIMTIFERPDSGQPS